MRADPNAKKQLRIELRARRDAVAAAVRVEWSLRIAAVALPALRTRAAGAVVSAYWPMRSEADPRPLAQALAAAGARLCLPAFVDDVMLFRRWQAGDELVPAGFSTMEPHPNAPPVAPTLVLAPLLGFDARGFRLGWGKGFYDRALAGFDAAAARGEGVRPFVVGVAFACQEVACIPGEPHDRRLDAVATESGYRTC